MTNTSLTFGAFPNAEEFLAWVATYHGSNISDACRLGIAKAATTGRKTDAMEDILNPLLRATREIDLAKNNFRAQFQW